MLYLIPTPIGNLEDMSHRAIRILDEVDLILAEDTRTSGKLLDHYGINTPLRAFHAHNEHKIVNGLVADLASGRVMALISDAGSPGISDPGFLLVRACVNEKIEVISLPGPTAFVPALTASGIPCDRFHFEGFLPHKKGRQTRLSYLSDLPVTFVLYESPFRLIKCLEEIQQHCGSDRLVCVCRELTKLHEEKITGPVSELLEDLKQRNSIKGEIVIVVAGKD